MKIQATPAPRTPSAPPTRAEIINMVRLLVVGSGAWAFLLCAYYLLGQWSFDHMPWAALMGVALLCALVGLATWLNKDFMSLSSDKRTFTLVSGAVPFNAIAFLAYARSVAWLDQMQAKMPNNVLHEEKFRSLLEQAGLIESVTTSKDVLMGIILAFGVGFLLTLISRSNLRVRRAGLILTLVSVCCFVMFIGWMQASVELMFQLVQSAS